MTMRRFLLWLTGTDVLKTTAPKNTTFGSITLTAPKPRFVLFIGPSVCMYVANAPNALHRALQYVVLGMKWKMLDADE